MHYGDFFGLPPGDPAIIEGNGEITLSGAYDGVFNVVVANGLENDYGANDTIPGSPNDPKMTKSLILVYMLRTYHADTEARGLSQDELTALQNPKTAEVMTALKNTTPARG